MAAGADHRWVASAVALTRLPAVGSEVFYFHQGHAEQFSVPAPEGDQPIPPVRCTITSIDFFTAGEEPYARISLLPANHGNQPAADTRPNPDSFLYFPKTLVQADVQRSYLAVPKLCVESLFPVLQAGTNTQVIHMSCLNGEAYGFQDLLAQNQKHDLRGQWRRFVEDKRALVGDTVFFIRRSDMSFLVELRRQQPVVDHGLQEPLQELQQSSQLAAQGSAFTVTFYPGRGSGSPFVVPRGAVDEAMRVQWEPGMKVRVRPRDLVLRAGNNQGQGAAFEVVQGEINRVTQPGLVWRNIQVDLDVPSSSSSATKNMWDVQAMRAQPPAAKRFKATTDDDQSEKTVKKIRLLGFNIDV